MKKHVIQLLLVCLHLPLWAQYNISGRIYQQANGNGLPFARFSVSDLDRSALADSNGYFTLSSLQSGYYQIEVEAEGFYKVNRRIKISGDTELEFRLIREIAIAEEVLIEATRASQKTPTTYASLDAEAIQKQNFGQDIPFLLDQLPSVVSTSDAGAGIGYTGIRIRGSDPTRINVTINGIPLNDPESHGVFWVNLPDFASSTQSIQVQRGVGTSTNGAAAFGASINMETSNLSQEAFATLDHSYGSFNTWKHSLQAGTGLLDGKFSFNLRLSRIDSDGFLDRSESELRSWFASGNYFGKKSLLKINVFSGNELTRQAWWGAPEALAKGDRAGLQAHIDRNFYSEDQVNNLLNSDRRYNFYTYDNQVDNYQQDHYQLFYSLEPSQVLSLNAALHYTRGQGFFEEFNADDSFSTYDLPNLTIGSETISSSDIIRRRWLDNHFYGLVWSARYEPSPDWEFTLGGGANRYDGEHFGEIIWARFAGATDIRDRYYESHSQKDDVHVYAKSYFNLSPSLTAYADLQLRSVDYQFGNEELNGAGTEQGDFNGTRLVRGDHQYTFFNPKVGLNFQLDPKNRFYASFSVANREPIRSDFIEARENVIPQEETLYDTELGYQFQNDKLSLGLVYYYMDYDNQLVLTGELNDVGASIRENVKNSFRTGVEWTASWKALPVLNIQANLAYSINRIREFSETLSNFDTGVPTVNRFTDTDISFSPSWVGASTISLRPVDELEISWIHKYVGEQFLDNTSNADRALDAFYVSNVRINYAFNFPHTKGIELGLLVNNIFDMEYEPNGYTFSFIAGGAVNTENFLYPQAGTNFLARVVLKL